MRNLGKILSIALVSMLAVVAPASAAICGGATICNCGDTVTTNKTLVLFNPSGPTGDPVTADICSGDGLIVAANVTSVRLDMDHNTITGDGTAGAAGIRLSGTNVVRVENGFVTGFAIGVGGATSGTTTSATEITNPSRINDMQVIGNGTGMLVNATLTIVETNTATGNDGDGIHVIGFRNLIIDHNELTGNGGHGVFVDGNSNKIENSSAIGNGLDGIHVVGNSNSVLTNVAYSNTRNGIDVGGASNLVKKNKTGDKNKGNEGDGIHVVGGGNTVRENPAYANGGDGINVSGGTSAKPNVILKNLVGDRGRGNTGNGIFVHGDTGNGTAPPIEVDSNTVRSNGGNGILIQGATVTAEATTIGAVSPLSTTVPIGVDPTTLGFPGSGTAVLGGSDTFAYLGVDSAGFTGVTAIDHDFPEGTLVTAVIGQSTATKHSLKNNNSGGKGDQANTGCQFDVAAENFNATGNKANGVIVTPNVNGAPFPTGCIN